MSENVNCICFNIYCNSDISIQPSILAFFKIFYKFLFIHEDMKITLKLMAGFVLYRKMCANRLFK